MSVFESVDFDGHEQVEFVDDAPSGLRAIIALHSTRLGPAIGGCRVWRYPDSGAALTDVLRLARGMTLKAACAGIPFGGGKAVVLAGPSQPKTPQVLSALGRAIDRLGGRYITGEDVGTDSHDMALLREVTPHVMGMPESAGGSGDPSPNTALGCFHGIVAGVQHRLGRSDLTGLRVAVQGLGNVGWNLCALLREAGAILLVADVRTDLADRAARAFDARVVEPAVIHAADADVFAPCALGAVLNDTTMARLQAKVVAGGANNQLQRPSHDAVLRDRGILYAPDFVINAGGMIQLAMERLGRLSEVPARVRAIGDTLAAVFEQARQQGVGTSQAAEALARRHLGQH